MKEKRLIVHAGSLTPTTAALSDMVALWWRGEALLCPDWMHLYLHRWLQHVHASALRFAFVVLHQT